MSFEVSWQDENVEVPERGGRGARKGTWASRVQAIKDDVTIFDAMRALKIHFTAPVTHNISCPFHGNDRHPSMRIYSHNDTYHCFACGRDGDVINMAMEALGEEFEPALRWLAKTFEIELPPLDEGYEEDRPDRLDSYSNFMEVGDDNDEFLTVRDAFNVLARSINRLIGSHPDRVSALETLENFFIGVDPDEEIPFGDVARIAQALS